MRKYGFVLLMALGIFLYFYFTPFTKDEKRAAEEGTGVLAETETINVDSETLIPLKTGIPLDYEWEFTFDDELDHETINDENIYILDENEEKVSVELQLEDKNKKVKIIAPADLYEKMHEI